MQSSRIQAGPYAGEGLLQGVSGACSHAIFFQAPLGYTGTVRVRERPPMKNLPNLLNGWGFYVQYGSDLPDRPAFLRDDTTRNPERLTFSLMEFRQPSEALPLFMEDGAGLLVIKSQTTGSGLYTWFRKGKMGASAPRPSTVDLTTGSRVLARNIMALIISPRLPSDGTSAACDYDIAPDFYYDSREFQLKGSINTGGDRNGSFIPQTSRHQLPPVLEVNLVAVDDASWSGFLDRGGNPQKYINFLKARFVTVCPIAVRGAASYELTTRDDLALLQEMLTSDKIASHVFSSTVQIRAAKWTTDADLPSTAR